MNFDINIDFDHLKHAPEEVTPEALGEAMEHIRGVAAERTPVETGRLVGSAAVHVDGDEASLSYEGPYARYQEFGLDLHHEHGQALYLTSSVKDEAHTAVDILARHVGEAL